MNVALNVQALNIMLNSGALLALSAEAHIPYRDTWEHWCVFSSLFQRQKRKMKVGFEMGNMLEIHRCMLESVVWLLKFHAKCVRLCISGVT